MSRRSSAKHHVVSIHKFATGKAAFNQKKKEDDERKRNEKSKMLREYAKLCKAEGIVSDRVNLETYEGRKAPLSKEREHLKSTKVLSKQGNPYKSASEEAEKKASIKAEAVMLSQELTVTIKKKNELREVQRRERMKRTKKGQPILSTQIASILGKLQKSAELNSR